MDWILLVVAAFFAGILNSIAGGGSFLTFPALVFAGIPPVAANATSAIAVFPGYLGGVAGFKKEIGSFDRNRLIRFILIGIVGGITGALLLLVTSNETFSLLVPWLLLAATILFALGGKLSHWLENHRGGIKVPENAVLLVVSIYGGYFNGGLGILLLAAFITFGMKDIHLMNGLKNGLSFVLSAVSVAVFVIAGLIHWPQAIVMMIAATAGGYYGAVIARKLPRSIIRGIITLTGAIMTLVFFFR